MIKYKFPDPPLSRAVCPNCGKRSFEVFECKNCGAVFCKYCRPDLVEVPDCDNESITVSCDCGSTGLFV